MAEGTYPKMRKTYDTAVHRRRAARRILVATASGIVLVFGKGALADDIWAPTAFPLNWSNTTAWSTGAVPSAGSVADIFNNSCNVNVSTGDLAGVQVANSANLNLTTSGSFVIETAALEVGGTNTGIIPGSNSNTGKGTVTQNYSTMEVDSGGVFAVDLASAYFLSNTGVILSSANEQLVGTFTQSGGTNQLSGASLVNAGLYTISAGATNCDSYVNTNVFNESGGTLQGAAALGTSGTFSFNNSNLFNYTGGNFYGVMNNSGSVQVNAATVPFTQGVINNGLLTINGSSGTFAGPISGGASGYLNFKGGINLTLTGNNNYSGSTVVTSGTLLLNCPLGGSSNHYGGAFQGPVTINTGATIENLAGNQISGISTVYINGGTYNLNGYDNSVGALNFSTGNVVTTSTGPGIGINSSTTVPGMISTTRGASTITGGIRCSNALQFNVSGNAPLTVNGIIGNYNTALGIPLILTGGGTLYFSGASRLNTIDIQNGTLVVNEGGSLGGFNTLVTVETGGALSVANQSLTIGDLTGGNPSTVDLGTGSLTVTSSNAGSTYPGTFSGSGTLGKSGAGTLTLTGNESSTGPLLVNAGTLTLTASSSLATTNVTVFAGATLNLNGTITSAPAVNNSGGINNVTLGSVALSTASGGGSGQINVALASPHTNRTLLQVNSLSFGGSTGAWVGQLDLSNNDMIIHNSNLATILNQVKSGYANGRWNGSGIASSAAAANTTHLTAIGVISNDLGNGAALYSLGTNMAFDNSFPVATDILLKYTYYGDANLDGQVDSTDYTLIDNAYLNNQNSANTALVGWYNGDFNYDGVINGSDYTLIDNAFNMQGSNLSSSAQIAAPTAQVAPGSSVPEPTAGMLLAALSASTLRRRSRRT